VIVVQEAPVISISLGKVTKYLSPEMRGVFEFAVLEIE
jgi:hypothetical protein